ncbi:uncharacterized protein PGTG_19724 [Puccinia graminis f. sp. tritici CRL 75-36-700-3]|uniref:Uncharacterized protein n=1 Tax=Puccinia graminis f. sp. tritici (strain CRL 75-36-700-3 / race SCCL) TaxID=418459 RepID=E3LB15_PUCGT|nr:uncharacterized protein PGTG_19724 [Puccinia graminis f. sp. tritici CRL 75-36-700-3]EFP93740.2 hypothetical protein PGTG_19724 [Puccinia graminis f. sp. tritici CRL 75-36-700-3]
MAPGKKKGKSAESLEDERYARLKNRVDEIERSIDLSMEQINAKFEGKPPPTVPDLSVLIEKVKQLEDSVATAESVATLEGRFSELETKYQEMYCHLEAEATALKDLNTRFAQLEESAVASNQLVQKICKLESKWQEMHGRMEVELQKTGQLTIIPCDNILANPNQARTAALESNFELMRKTLQTSQEAASKDREELLKHRSEMSQLHNLGQQILKQMAHLEKSSRQTGSRIESILRGGNSVIKRQDEIDGKLEAIKGTVSDLSNQMMSMAQATEIDDSPTDIDAVMENLKKKYDELLQDLQPRLEQATQNSQDIEIQRQKLDSLNAKIPQFDQVSQDHRKLLDKVAILEAYIADLPRNNTELQLVDTNMQTQSSDIIQTERIADLVKSKCDESLSAIQCSLRAGLESLEKSLLVTQSNALRPVIDESAQTSTELRQQRKQLQSIIEVKAQIEGRILGLENANKKIEADFTNANSAVHRLTQECQLISQRQETTDNNISELSREKNIEGQISTLEETAEATQSTIRLLIEKTDQIGPLKETVMKILNFIRVQTKSCAGNQSSSQNKSIVEVASSPDNISIHESDPSEVEADRSHFRRRSGVEHESDHDDQTNRQHDISERSRPRPVQQAKEKYHSRANLGAHSNPEEESDLSPAGNDPSTSRRESRPKPVQQAKEKYHNRANLGVHSDPDEESDLSPAGNDPSTSRRESRPKPVQQAKEKYHNRANLGVHSDPDEESDLSPAGNDPSTSRREFRPKPVQQAKEKYHNRANLGVHSDPDEESDSSPPRNNPSTSRRPLTPDKLTKHQKFVRADKNNKSSRPKRRSLRKEREDMEPSEKDDDINLAKAVQAHIRILMGLPRQKDAFPRSPTPEELISLPELEGGSAPLPVSAPYKIKKVVKTWDPEDEMGDGFASYCLERIKQYGLPFVGLSISLENPKALEWNRRTAAFCHDTFYRATVSGDYGQIFRSGYDLHDGGLARAETLIQMNLNYRITEMTKDLKRARGGSHLASLSDNCDRPNDSEDGALRARRLRESDEQKDRRYARQVALAERRYQTSCAIPELHKYRHLFRDERLCSSDESDSDSGDTRIRHAPVWRSNKATALVERIDELTKTIRTKSRAGRKPAKRLNRGAEAPLGGLVVTPRQLPQDCYGSLWLSSLSAEKRKGLRLEPTIFDE